MEQEAEKFLNILGEDRLKLNCNFASLYVLYYECLKDTLVDLPKTFFNQMEIKDGELSMRESNKYKKNVKQLDRHIENASLKWFVNQGAVSEEEYSNFDKLRNFRNKLVHELLLYLTEGFTEDKVKYLVELITLYKKIEKWWINEIEIPISGNIHESYDSENVVSGQGLMLEIIQDVLLNDGKNSEEILSELYKLYK